MWPGGRVVHPGVCKTPYIGAIPIQASSTRQSHLDLIKYWVMGKERLGLTERTKKLGKEVGISAAEVWLGLALTGGPLLLTLAGLIFVYRGVGRAGRAVGVA